MQIAISIMTCYVVFVNYIWYDLIEMKKKNKIKAKKSYRVVETKKKNTGEYVDIVKWAFVIAALIIFTVYAFDALDVPTRMGLVSPENSREWLDNIVGYFGIIAGAFIGFFSAMIPVKITLERQEEIRREDNAKRVLPLVKIDTWQPSQLGDPVIEKIDFDKGNNTSIGLYFAIQNVGLREMYDVWCDDFCGDVKRKRKRANIAEIIYKDEWAREDYMLQVNRLVQSGTMDLRFRVHFKDCYGNGYYQMVKCKCELVGGISDDGRAHYRADEYVVIGAPMNMD